MRHCHGHVPHRNGLRTGLGIGLGMDWGHSDTKPVSLAPEPDPQRHMRPCSWAYRVAALLLATPIFLKIDRR
jgi:hypothetical protein